MAARRWEDKLKDKIKKHFLIDSKTFIKFQNDLDFYEHYCYKQYQKHMDKHRSILKRKKINKYMNCNLHFKLPNFSSRTAYAPACWRRLCRPTFRSGKVAAFVSLNVLSTRLSGMRSKFDAREQAVKTGTAIARAEPLDLTHTQRYSRHKQTTPHKVVKVLHRDLNIFQLGNILVNEGLAKKRNLFSPDFIIKEEGRKRPQKWSSNAAYAFYMQLKQQNKTYNIVKVNTKIFHTFDERIRPANRYRSTYYKEHGSKYLFTILINDSDPLIGAALLREEAEHSYRNKLSLIPFKKVLTTWHGAPFSALRSILHGGLIINGSSGLLGRGIYLTPDIAKTYAYTGNYDEIMLIVECKMRPGIVLTSSSGHGSSMLKPLNREQAWSRGFQAAFAGPKYRAGANAKLAYSEYAVYDRRQVQVTALHIYRPPIKEPKPW